MPASGGRAQGAFLKANDGGFPIHGDVRHRPLPAVRLHVYGAGPPCQPWARGGKRKGLRDERGGLYFEAMRLIYHNRPLAIFIENNDLLMGFDGGRFVRSVTGLLRTWGYVAQAARVRACDHGLPTPRRRAYIVGLHRDVGVDGFCWPPPVQPMDLESLLDPTEAEDSADRLPEAAGAAFAAGRAASRAAGGAVPPGRDWIVNVHHSRGWAAAGSRPTTHCPTLAAACAEGPWVGSRGRHLRVGEAARIQGVPAGALTWPRRGVAFKLLGNTMSGAVVSRLAVLFLSACGGHGGRRTPGLAAGRRTS